MLDFLPKDLIKYLISFSDLPDLSRLTQVNKQLHYIVSEMKCAIVIALPLGLQEEPEAYTIAYLQSTHAQLSRMMSDFKHESKIKSRLAVLDAKKAILIGYDPFITDIMAAACYSLGFGALGLTLGAIPSLFLGAQPAVTWVAGLVTAFGTLAGAITMSIVHDRAILTERKQLLSEVKKQIDDETRLHNYGVLFSQEPPATSPIPTVLWPRLQKSITR